MDAGRLQARGAHPRLLHLAVDLLQGHSAQAHRPARAAAHLHHLRLGGHHDAGGALGGGVRDRAPLASAVIQQHQLELQQSPPQEPQGKHAAFQQAHHARRLRIRADTLVHVAHLRDGDESLHGSSHGLRERKAALRV